MALDAEKVRSFIQDLLKETKALTEKEVKVMVAKTFKTSPKEIGARMIRDIRKSLGIDRPAALAHAKAMLVKDPLLEGKAVVEAIASKFGIRLGPPDVSRLRPKSAKRSRPRGRRAKANGARRGPGRPPAKAASQVEAKAAAAPKAKPGPKPRLKARAATALKAGSISLSFEGAGRPEDLAAFFLSLGREG